MSKAELIGGIVVKFILLVSLMMSFQFEARASEVESEVQDVSLDIESATRKSCTREEEGLPCGKAIPNESLNKPIIGVLATINGQCICRI